ncbi:MAG: trypsin-like peptidase domain-containing protein [Gammaproteobacteria bacterium]|nr:trypsin-like peptidase domain-containing protein [Gammaproteobacteria bacterium]
MLALLCFGCLSMVSSTQAKQADELFKTYSSALVQIKSINIGSGQKSSIGTGFFISESGRIVTNYHVISGFVQTPDKFRLEYIDEQEQKFPVTVIAVDVINDLALLQTENISPTYFNLAKKPPVKGADLFALGNPHDLGMIVVPGTYNGIKQNSFNERIHFTGSINSGMSGGPTVDKQGDVVGINVATAGNQIGFLVPVIKLQRLVEHAGEGQAASEDDLIASIREQLIDNQNALFEQLIQNDWQSQKLGDANVLKELADFMPCWGNSNKDKEKTKFISASSNCSLDERVYLSNNLTTGHVLVGFSWIKSDSLTELQLSNLYANTLNQNYGRNNAKQEDVTNYHCAEDFVENSTNDEFKSVTCVRAYRKYEGLFDVTYRSLLLGKENQALVSRYTLQGVTEQTANNFFNKFVESVSWQ